MIANFYEMSKRKNSTLRPASASGAYNVDVTLNDAKTSILNPSIRVGITSTGILRCNYCYIAAFSRYYYINNWTYGADGCWTAELSVDTLATWRTEILSSSGYVGRCANNLIYDTSIIDSLYPATTNCKVVTNSASTGFPWGPANGLYVIGVISSAAPNVGCVAYYMVTATELTKMLQKMTTVSASDSDWSNISSITGDVLKSIVNPMQYVVSCKWFPETRTITSSYSIRLWGWDTTAKGQKIDNNSSVGTKVIDIDLSDVSVPSGAAYTNYPRYAPYAQYSLITPWGTFDLDANIMAQYRSMQVAFTINHISGTATIVGQIPNAGGAGHRIELFRKEVQFALDIPLAQISTDYVNMAKSAVNALGAMGNVGAWMTNPGSNAAAVANGAIDAAVYALSPSVQSTAGSGATFSPEISTIFVQQIRYATFEPDADDYGRPVKRKFDSLTTFQKSAISSGYVQLDHSNFHAARITPFERDDVINQLETGVFLE